MTYPQEEFNNPTPPCLFEVFASPEEIEEAIREYRHRKTRMPRPSRKIRQPSIRRPANRLRRVMDPHDWE